MYLKLKGTPEVCGLIPEEVTNESPEFLLEEKTISEKLH